jgi:hypothetical protein
MPGRRVRRSLVAAAAVGAQLAAPGVLGAQQPSPGQVTGCYVLELGPWQPPLVEANADFHTPPPQFRLRADTIDAIRSRAEPPIRHAHVRGFARAWWEPLPRDSVRIVWSDGFTGAEMRVRLAGDSLVGRVAARTDDVVPGPAPRAQAVARRTDCP